MSLGAAIAYFRQQQQELMDTEGSTVTVTRPSEESSFDANTGEETPDAPSTIYEGPCQIRTSDLQGSDVQAGEEEVQLRAARMKLLVDTSVRKGDVVTVTASSNDADLVGRVFDVTDVFLDDWQIARVVLLEEAT
jgi:hypothetical protein